MTASLQVQRPRRSLQIQTIQQDSSAKTVMITSLVPGVFCAGADLKKHRTMSPSQVHTYVNFLRYIFSFIEALSIPTIAAIEGVALGGGLEMALSCGLEMALSCDLRICGENAGFGLRETGLAVIPGAGGTISVKGTYIYRSKD